MRDQMRDSIASPDDLDLLLDSALATYADPGRDSGFEDRVVAALAPIRTEGHAQIVSRRRGWLPWAIAIPVAAGLILLLLFRPTRVVRAPEQAGQAQPAPVISAPATTPFFTASGEHRVKSAPLRRAAPAAPSTSQVQPQAAAALPKLDVFPTPQPLTEQEQALLSYAQRAPTAQLQALSEAQAQDEDPFPVATVHIPTFEPPTQGKD